MPGLKDVGFPRNHCTSADQPGIAHQPASSERCSSSCPPPFLLRAFDVEMYTALCLPFVSPLAYRIHPFSESRSTVCTYRFPKTPRTGPKRGLLSLSYLPVQFRPCMVNIAINPLSMNAWETAPQIPVWRKLLTVGGSNESDMRPSSTAARLRATRLDALSVTRPTSSIVGQALNELS